MPEDILQKFMFEKFPVKGSLVRLEDSWKEVQLRAQPHVDAAKMLGETLCATVLLTSNIKFQGSISLQIQSSGHLRLLVAQCSDQGSIRGIVRMNEESESALLEDAVLAINLEPESGGSPYQGIVEMSNVSLLQALERYFLQSEQLETRFWLVSDGSRCSGLMLQRMPGEAIDEDGWNRVQQLAASLTQEELNHDTAEALLHKLFNEEDVRLFGPSKVAFKCSCSTEKISGVLHALGQEDITDLVEERGDVEVRCEYCGQYYRFDRVDVAALFTSNLLVNAPSSNSH